MSPRQPLNVTKLYDHGGQYVLMIKCAKCRHSREARPETFARLTGWETPLGAILERLRCCKCGVSFRRRNNLLPMCPEWTLVPLAPGTDSSRRPTD